MSTISFTIETQAIDFSPETKGEIIVLFNDGNIDIPLILELSTISISGKFLEVEWVDGLSDEDENQCIFYSLAFARDFKNIGGQKNLSATSLDNVVTITSKTGTFGSLVYTGDVLVVGTPTIDNSASTVAPELVVAMSDASFGNCSTIEYTISATGDGAPFRLSNNSDGIAESWDGSELRLNFDRGSVQNLQLREPLPSFAILDQATILPPRQLKTSEFKQRITQYEGYSDIIIENVNPVADTEPIEYSLDVEGTLTGQNYQTSNAFTGVLPGFYELFVKDQFGCEITKTIQVYSLQDTTEEQNPRYFEVQKGNSIIMSECVEFSENVKKNFNNTLSHNEISQINYQAVQSFYETDSEPIHFKSSYPYHTVTFHKSDGTKQDISFVMVQENLGSLEKVDCSFFQLEGKIAVYFDGGNEYEPNTTTIKDDSPYTQYLPGWAEEGQIVSIDGLGAFEIDEIGYDSDLERGYFLVNATTTDSVGKVQVTWNIQDYNVFVAYVPFSNIDSGRVVIEKGFLVDGLMQADGNFWISELLKVKEYEVCDLLVQWSSTKNQNDIVFFSGIEFKKRVKGKFRPFFPNSSEIAEGDSRAYKLDQQFFQHYRLEIDMLTAREVYQLLVASSTDGLTINNEPLVWKQEAEIEALGESNYFSFKCEYASGGDGASIQEDSLALNPSTGVVGGGSTGKPSAPITHDGKTRLMVGSGFVTVGGNFISVDV